MANILITGASSGIGKAIFELLQKENQVFITGRRKLDAPNYFELDLTKLNLYENLIDAAHRYFNGEIEVLINCAGAYIYKPLENMSLEEINYLIDLNFKSAYFLSSLVIKDMKKNNKGRIINIGSISGAVGEAFATLYSATKAALGGFSKALALEVAQNNITVNQINPGWVETPLSEKALDEEDKKDILDITPQKRFVEPIEIAHLCKYLISDEAKGLTGQNINLCAGLSIGC